MNSSASALQRDERTSAAGLRPKHTDDVFESLFERSADAIWLHEISDPQTAVLVDCNQAAVKLIGAESRQQLLSTRPEELSPPFQPDGTPSAEKAVEIIGIVQRHKTHRFEWALRRLDGKVIPIEVSVTAVVMGGKRIHVAISRDISERKKAERDLLEMAQALERRVTDRTAELSASEARFRALVEHAPEAIVVFDGVTGRFLFGNEHACRVYDVPMEKLAELRPGDVSPEFQPDGRRSSELAREKMDEALAGGKPVFEWIHQQPNGWLIPTEVRLLRLPAEGQNLIRASIIDNTERKRAERALREANRELHREIEQRTRAEESLKERVRMSTLDAEVAVALNAGVELQPMLQRCCELMVQHLDVAFARIWLLNTATQTLELQASAGCYTHLDGPHSRVKVGQYKIGLIAQNQEPLLTNSVQSDPRVSDKAWATREGMTAFAGYPLLIEDRVLGVLGMFARHPLGDDVLTTLRSIADSLALGIERKRAEEELRASEARLRESEARFSVAFRASPVSIVIFRMDDGRCVLANESFLKWAGYRLDEVLGRNSLELGIWEDPAERASLWQELRRTQSIHERECRLTNRHGQSFIMLISAEVIEINGVPQALTVGVDITERKRAQAALAESEARFSAAFHASPALIGILRVNDGKYVLVNDAHLNWLGYSRGEVLGRTCLELGMWADTAESDSLLQDMSASGSVRQRECCWRNRHGEQFTVLLSTETITLNDTPHVLLMALDISQRKRAEEELKASEARWRESENRFSVAFQASPVFISILRTSTEKYVLANDALLNWLGFSRDEVLGRTSGELGMWDNPAERVAVWRDLRTIGSIRQRECRWRSRRSELATVLLSAETITLNNEPHVLSLVLDISERKNAEVETLKALAREKELSQLKSNFVSMVSHEFRTPLGIIQSSAELLDEFLEKMKPEERQAQLESIVRNTRRMAGMMEEILVLSRLDAGKLDFKPALLDLNVFFRRVADEVLSATNRRCLIQLSLRSVPSEAKADERVLGHIFTNLLSNAVKYSEPGATVHLEVACDDHNVICIVRDQGIGISESDQLQLFKAFHRGGNVGTRPGTGLGLLLVKRCVELHGGMLELKSRIGEGTTVTVKLPVLGEEE